MSHLTNAWLLLSLVLPSEPLLAQTHPLDPVSGAELRRGLAVLRSSGLLSTGTDLASLSLKEPAKAAVLAGQALPRQLAAVTYGAATNRTTEVTIDLGTDRIVDSRVVPGVTPQHLSRDHRDAGEILRRDTGWRGLLSGREKNPDSVEIFAYPIGAFGPAGATDRLAIVRVDGIIAYLNLTKRRVYRLVDAGGPGPGDAESPFDPARLVATRDPSPPKTELRGSAGFQRSGYAVEWDQWSFRIGLAPKEGLLLYQAAFGAKPNRRSVLYKASLSELWVPYGDRGQRDFYLNAFDIGEVGIARYGRPEVTAADCPSHAEFIPIAYLDPAAEVVEVDRGFCLYERDGGTAWRHGTEGRRQRQLVLSSVFRIDNYDYGVNWIFHQDGTLEAEVILTGIMNVRPSDHAIVTAAVPDTSYSTLVAPHVEAMHHQHFFSFRLDLDVAEAGGNSVVEMNTVAPPRGPANPHGNAIQLRQTVLTRELAARRDLNLASHRSGGWPAGRRRTGWASRSATRCGREKTRCRTPAPKPARSSAPAMPVIMSG